MIGIRLTKNESGNLDMLMENGAFVMAEDGEAAASALALAIETDRRECEESPIVDTVDSPLAGLDMYGIVFNVKTSRAEKEIELRRLILSVPGIKKILRFQWSQTAGAVTITADIQTDWGTETVAQVVTPL